VVGSEARHPAGAALSEAIFTRDGARYVPSAHARGPWDPGALHGGAPAALLAEAVARAGDDEGEGMAVARLTYEFLGPVPLAPLTIAAEVVRPGRRFQLVEAEARDESGRPLLRARAMRLRRADVAIPAAVERGGRPPGGGPDDARPSPFPVAPGQDPRGFHRTGMEIRFGGGTSFENGPALAWLRLALPLIGGEPPSPLARVAAAADFGNGASRVLDFEDHLFVNTDLTVHLHRDPAGEWVLLDAVTRVEPEGRGLAWSVLYDERGPLGVAAQTLYVDAR
jgi:acyl-coenzyme A thioesterase PaaI-like protein